MMADFTKIESVLQKVVERPSREGISSVPSSSFGDPDFTSDFLPRQSCRQPGNTTEFYVEREDLADERSFLGIGNELSVFEVVSQRHGAAHPYAFSLRGGNLVPNPFSSDLPFKLREGKQDVQGEPAHGRRGVELLGNRDERYAMGVERLNDLGEVCQTPREPVDLVDDDDVHFLRFYIFQ